MGKRSKTPGGTFPANKLSLSELDAKITTLEWRVKSGLNSAQKTSAIKMLVDLEKERARIYGVPAPPRRRS